MPYSYQPAGAGQSGSTQSALGAIVGLDSGNDDNYDPTYYSKLIAGRAKKYGKLLDPKAVTAAYEEFNRLYRANDALAKENAGFYSDKAKGILGDDTRTVDTYERIRSGNLASLGDVFKNVLDYGLSSQKARLAAGGYGGSGPNAYDKILNSTQSAANLGPILQTIYGNIGRDATAAVGGDRSWDAYRLGQFATDPLTGYADAATAGRALTPLNAYRGLINNDIGTMSNLLRNVIIPNVSGYQLDPGLSSRLNNVAAGTMNLAKFGTDLMSSYGGMMGGGGMGGMGGGTGAAMGGQQMNPQMMQQAMQMYQQYGGAQQAQIPAGNYYVPSYGASPGVDVPATTGYPTTMAYA